MLKVLVSISEENSSGDDPASGSSMEEEKAGELNSQRGGFRSFALEVTQAWELFVNEIKDLPGPVSSGIGSKNKYRT